MEESQTLKKIFGTIGYVLVCIVFVALLVIAVGVLIRTINEEFHRIYLGKYIVIGFVSFFILFIIPRVRSNVRWSMKFAHEFSHLFFAILFFRKIVRFKVDQRDSHVVYSGGWFGYHAITLSPYCIPIYTLALFPWRFTVDSLLFLSVIDLLIGFTFAFYICCWVKQIRLSQTDIIGPGIIKSLLIIAFFQIVSFCLIVQAPSSGIEKTLLRVFNHYPCDVINAILTFIKG